jgi:mannose-6-phosphate isomerase-like protein (cupin superfamily)
MESLNREPFYLNFRELVDKNQTKDIWQAFVFEDDRYIIEIVKEPAEYPLYFSTRNDLDEWWIILEGSLNIEIDNNEPCIAKMGNVINIESGYHDIHLMTGSESCIRLIINKKIGVIALGSVNSSYHQPCFYQNTTPINLLDSKFQGSVKKSNSIPATITILEDSLNRADLIWDKFPSVNTSDFYSKYDEWHLVLQGDITWEFGSNNTLIHSHQGDFIFVPKGIEYKVNSNSKKLSLKLSVIKY